VPNDPYLIPGSDCLQNKLGVLDAKELSAFEAEFAHAREAELSRFSLPGRFDVAHLCAFHLRIFGDVYPWAGEFRTVAINKDGTEFCRPQFLADQVGAVLAALDREDLLIGLRREPFVEKLAAYYGELNVCHPFREGNGRTQRAFLRQLAAAAGFRLSWSAMDAVENVQACRLYYVKQDPAPLIDLLLPITARM
jgi:cell filamentation protein